MSLTLPDHLPRELIGRQRWREIVLCWSLALVGVVIFNALCYGMLNWKPINKTTAVVTHKWQILQNCKQNLDLLILGDSSGNQGVDPDVFRDQLGIDSLNLCTTGSGLLLDDRIMLEDYLSKHPAPRAVLLVHVYDVWQRILNRSFLNLIPYSTGQLQKRMQPYPLTWLDRGFVWCYRYVPIFYMNVSLKKIAYQPLKYIRQQWQFNATGFEAQTTISFPRWKQDVRAHMAMARTYRSIDFSPINIQNLKIMTQLAQKYDFELFLVMAPIASELYHEKEFRQYYNQVPERLGAYAQKNDRVHLLFGEPFRATSQYMQSADHVTADAAERYSQLLANQIQWVFPKSQFPVRFNSK